MADALEASERALEASEQERAQLRDKSPSHERDRQIKANQNKNPPKN